MHNDMCYASLPNFKEVYLDMVILHTSLTFLRSQRSKYFLIVVVSHFCSIFSFPRFASVQSVNDKMFSIY